MINLYYVFGICFILYGIVDFKKKTGNTVYDRYYNSKYYRLLFYIGGTAFGALIIFIYKLCAK